jgi:transposase
LPGLYPGSVTDEEWALLEPVFAPARRGRGRPGRYPRRLLLDAIFYVVRSGCAWRLLPRDFPPWENVYATFRRWAREGRFERMHDELRRLWRERIGRDGEPTAGIVDSQSARSTEKGGLVVLMGPKK